MRAVRVFLSLCTAVAAVAAGTASADDSGSFITRIRESMRMTTIGDKASGAAWRTPAGDENAWRSTSDTGPSRLSFIARVEESQRVPAGIGEAYRAPSTDLHPSWIARIQSAQRLEATPEMTSEAQTGREQLRLVQRALGEHGFATPVTGEYDDSTRAAVTAFQQSQQLPSNGMLDRPTQKALGVDVGDVTPVRGARDGM